MYNFLQLINFLFNYTLFNISGQPISFYIIARLIFGLIIAVVIAQLIKLICQQWLLEKLKFDVGNREAFSGLIFYFFITLGTIIALQSTGINLASLAVVVGGLGIGIGFGLQSIARDFISGLILLLGRSVKVNDFVQFGKRQEFVDVQGTVQKISVLFTVVQTKDRACLIVPNSYLVTYPLLNWSYNGKINRLKIPLKVGKDIDFVLFTEIILNTAYTESSVQKEPPPKLIFKEIQDYYCEFELQVWIDDIKNEDFTKNRLNYGFEYHLNQHGINLIFPTHQISLNRRNLPDNNENQQINAQEKPLSVRDILKKVSYFSNLTNLEIRQLIEVGYRQKLESDVILFNEGDPGDAFYIILSGSVEIFVPKINKHLATLRTGDFFGELSLIFGIPRTASVRTFEKTLLFVINKQGFNKILHEQLELAEVIIEELAKHQKELSQRQEQLREMGLISPEEDDTNLVNWIRKRFHKIFSLPD